jgi:hypothetical protein
MSKLLSELVAQLELDIPAEDSVPTEVQYENAVKDAIADFSEQCGLEQIETLSIVSGTATYDLPADFLRLISLTQLGGVGVMFSAESQIIPLSGNWCERHTIRNGRITFYPVPRYSLQRYFSYKAAWIGTDIEAEGSEAADVEYETMGEREARIVLMKAKALASTKKANAQAGSAIKYSFGAVSEDLGGVSEASVTNAESFENEYLEACKVYNGQHASYGD